MDASKVNVLPKVEEPTVSKKNVEYATTFFPATSVPAGLMRPYTGKKHNPAALPDMCVPVMAITAISMYSPIIYSACLIKTN